MADSTGTPTASPTKGTSTSPFTPEKIFGIGHWKSGTTVRDIEGHFHKENEPKDVDPISHDGGVPGVDLIGKAKAALTGHHGDSTTSHSGSGAATSATGAHTSGTGLTGTGATTSTAGATGSAHDSSISHSAAKADVKAGHDGVADLGTEGGYAPGTKPTETKHSGGVLQKAKEVLTGNSDTGKVDHVPAGHGHHDTSSGTKAGAVPATGAVAAAAAGTGSQGSAVAPHSATLTGPGDATSLGTGVPGSTLNKDIPHVSDNATSLGSKSTTGETHTQGTGGIASALGTTGGTSSTSGPASNIAKEAGITQNTTTGTTATAAPGATHGVSDVAERDLVGQSQKDTRASSTIQKAEAAAAARGGYQAKPVSDTGVSKTKSNTGSPAGKEKTSFFSKVKEALS